MLYGKNVALSIGTFDGVHLGHQKVIDKLVEVARKRNIFSVVVTFSNVPRAIVKNEEIFTIIDNLTKEKLLKDRGVDFVYTIPFTKVIQKMTRKEFLSMLALTIDCLVIGYDFNFGNKEKKDEFDDVEIIRVESYKLNDEIVSSSLIRKFLKEGNIKKVNEFLNTQYKFVGRVIRGNALARSLGFPTINISPNKHVSQLKYGVYITSVKIKERFYKSITNFGVRPTTEHTNEVVETYILDEYIQLYNEVVEIYFYDFLRKEKKFKSFEELKNQISSDVIISRNYER